MQIPEAAEATRMCPCIAILDRYFRPEDATGVRCGSRSHRFKWWSSMNQRQKPHNANEGVQGIEGSACMFWIIMLTRRELLDNTAAGHACLLEWLGNNAYARPGGTSSTAAAHIGRLRWDSQDSAPLRRCCRIGRHSRPVQREHYYPEICMHTPHDTYPAYPHTH